MVQICMLVGGVIAGLAARSWRQAWLALVVVFAAVSVVQTILVLGSDDVDSPAVYWGIQAITLPVGLGIARLVSARRLTASPS